MSGFSEEDIIRLAASTSAAPQGTVGIGDDCAVIGNLLVTTDLLAEGVHFLPDAAPLDVGYKSAMVNISDVAAMGGTPQYAFLSLSLPKERATWASGFMDGFTLACRGHGVALMGGDTCRSEHGIFVNVTLIGSCPEGTALLRSTARPGDLLAVTGTLGDSAAGLEILLEGPIVNNGLDDALDVARKYLVQRHCRPEARVAEGQALRLTPGVHAMMDLSDGLAADLPKLLAASGGLGATVDAGSLPLSPALVHYCREISPLGSSALGRDDKVVFAAEGGEDYELLFTMAPGTEPAVPYTVIGRIESEPGIRWEGLRGEPQGFRHF